MYWDKVLPNIQLMFEIFSFISFIALTASILAKIDRNICYSCTDRFFNRNLWSITFFCIFLVSMFGWALIPISR